jgi:hypothetical protein
MENILDLKQFDGMELENMLSLFKSQEFIDNCYNLFNNINQDYKFYTVHFNLNNIITRKILTAYLIFYYKEEIVLINDDIVDDLFIKSRKLIFDFDKLYNENNLKNFNIFKISLDKYLNTFEQWKYREGLILARPLIFNYFHYEKKYNGEENEDYKKELKTMMDKIKNNILILLGNEETEKILREKVIPISSSEPIIKQTKNVAHQAFWDLFRENMNKNDKKALLVLLNEIKDCLKDISPQNKNLIEENIDLEIFGNIIELSGTTTIPKDYILNIYNLITEIIKKELSKEDIKKIEIVDNKIKERYNTLVDSNTLEFLIYTLKYIYNILEQIKILN